MRPVRAMPASCRPKNAAAAYAYGNCDQRRWRAWRKTLQAKKQREHDCGQQQRRQMGSGNMVEYGQDVAEKFTAVDVDAEQFRHLAQYDD